MVVDDDQMRIGASSYAQPQLVLELIGFVAHLLDAAERIWLPHIHTQDPLLLHLLHIPLN